MDIDLDHADIADRVRGCLLGGAVGDALGAAVEFHSLAEIRRRFGPDGLTDYAEAYGRRGAITDDTQMTLWTAEGLIRADNRLRERGERRLTRSVHRAYLRWLATQDEWPPWLDGEARTDSDFMRGWLLAQPELHHLRAPGNTCLSALSSGQFGTVEQPINDSKGCGGIMRIAPVGLVSDSEGAAFRDGCALAALTHGHPSGYLAAGAFTLIINSLMRGTPLPQSLDLALSELNRHPGHEETTDAIEHARALASSRPFVAKTVEELGQGWVAEEALAIAVYCALVSDNFQTGVLLAVNHSGDSDSTGSLAGQLIGVQHGVQAIPTHWLDQLEGRDIIEQMANDLIKHFIAPPSGPPMPEDRPMGQTWPPLDDLDRYPPN